MKIEETKMRNNIQKGSSEELNLNVNIVLTSENFVQNFKFLSPPQILFISSSSLCPFTHDHD